MQKKKKKKLEFTVGDDVFFNIELVTGIMRFGKKGKLNPKYICPFEILERVPGGSTSILS